MTISSTENTRCGVLPSIRPLKHRFPTMLHCPAKDHAQNYIFKNILATAFVTGFATSLTPAFAADPTGDWRVQDGVADIRVAECNGSMWGVVAWEKVPGGHDKNNPDASKQNRPTLGMPILLDMKKTPGARSVGRASLQRQGWPNLHVQDQAGRRRSTGDPGLRARLPLWRRNLDPGCRSDPLKPRRTAWPRAQPKTADSPPRTGAAAPKARRPPQRPSVKITPPRRRPIRSAISA